MIELTLSKPSGKPTLGGWLPGLVFSAARAAVLDAAADQLIPGGDGFPWPSHVDVVGFIGRYIAPAGQEAKWYPFLREEDFLAHIDALGEAFVGSSSEQQIVALQSLERDDPEFFTKFRDLVYHAYYSRPEVVRAINENLEAGKDYQQTPQPFGYSETIMDWDDEMLARVRGSYKRTDDVVRVPLPDTLAGPGQKAVGSTHRPTNSNETAVDEVRLLESGIGNPVPDHPMA